MTGNLLGNPVRNSENVQKVLSAALIHFSGKRTIGNGEKNATLKGKKTCSFEGKKKVVQLHDRPVYNNFTSTQTASSPLFVKWKDDKSQTTQANMRVVPFFKRKCRGTMVLNRKVQKNYHYREGKWNDQIEQEHNHVVYQSFQYLLSKMGVGYLHSSQPTPEILCLPRQVSANVKGCCGQKFISCLQGKSP